MRKIIASTFMSLDGVMQAPAGPEDASGGFSLGGWSLPFYDEIIEAVGMEIPGGPYELLLGRRTYDLFASFWPRITDPQHPVASVFNQVTKYVASRTRPTLQWHNSRLLDGDVVASVRGLKSEEGPDLLVPGSGALLQTLWRHQLVDELCALIFPVVLGSGRRLFGEGAMAGSLKLVESLTSPSGVIVAYYVPDGPVRTVSLADSAGDVVPAPQGRAG